MLDNLDTKDCLPIIMERCGIPEEIISHEAVCGSAHYQIAAYWSRVFEQSLRLKAYSASRRGIVLTANYKGGSITVFSQDKKGKLQRDTKIIRFAGNGPNKKKAGTIASALRDLYT